MSDLEQALAHKYRLNDKPLVNVTAISGLLDDGKSGAFAGAAVKLTKEGLNYREEWKASGERGTRVHGHVDDFLNHRPINCLPSDMGFVDAIEKFMTDREPHTFESEQIVLSEHGYGGRFDLVVEMDGETWLLDAKTGRPYPVEHTLQLSAYRYATGIAIYGSDGTLMSLREMPYIDRTGCLYLREDGTYSLTEYPASKEAFEVFLGLLRAHQWTRTDEMKAVVKASRA